MTHESVQERLGVGHKKKTLEEEAAMEKKHPDIGKKAQEPHTTQQAKISRQHTQHR